MATGTHPAALVAVKPLPILVRSGITTSTAALSAAGHSCVKTGVNLGRKVPMPEVARGLPGLRAIESERSGWHHFPAAFFVAKTSTP
jgi:hypothetical protein